MSKKILVAFFFLSAAIFTRAQEFGLYKEVTADIETEHICCG